ncbi:hypothetical protein IFR05_011371 [Cadophora sp. M221]|nr:hypothetical protein IFR05_011371 [Cadophora sp. M221]
MAGSEPDSRFSGIYKSGKYSDFSIICSDRRWKIHKAIVCPQWHALDAALDGNFKESQVGEYDLSAYDPEVVNLMIHFFYHGTIPLRAATNLTQTRPCLSHDKIADRACSVAPPYWTIHELSAHCERKARRRLRGRGGRSPHVYGMQSAPIGQSAPHVRANRHAGGHRNCSKKRRISQDSGLSPIPNSVASADLSKVVGLYLLADCYNITRLRELARSKYEASIPNLWNTTSFVDSIQHIYEETPDTNRIDDLRRLAIEIASFPGHMMGLMAKENFLSLFNDNVDFRRDLVLGTAKWTSTEHFPTAKNE